MLDSYCRKSFQKWLVDPLLRSKAVRKIGPSAITALAFLFGTSIPFLLAWKLSYWATCTLALTGFLDVLDGSLARYLQRSSPKGAVFDIVCDRWVEFCIILGLYLVDPSLRSFEVIGMLGAVLICITSFLVVGIFTPNNSHKSFHYSPGFMERTEAFLFFGAMILFPAYFTLLAVSFSVLVFATAALRIVQFATQDISS